MTIRYVVSVAALVGLTACGGGGGSLGGVASFTSLDAEADRLIAVLASSSQTNPLPASTFATYNGIILIGDDLEEAPEGKSGFVGQVTLTAEFDGAREADINGSAGNFYSTILDKDGNPDGSENSSLAENSSMVFSGEATTSQFTLNIVAIDSEIDGTAISGDMLGQFSGENAEIVSATATGRSGSTELFYGDGRIEAVLIAEDR